MQPDTIEDVPNISSYDWGKAVERMISEPATPTQRQFFYCTLSGLLLAVAVWLGMSQQPIAFPTDDAYITLHSANVLLSGRDPITH